MSEIDSDLVPRTNAQSEKDAELSRVERRTAVLGLIRRHGGQNTPELQQELEILGLKDTRLASPPNLALLR